MPTQDECLVGFGHAMAESAIACEQMTPREQAEAAWTPTSPYTVDELEDRIRARRGMQPAHTAQSA